MHVVFVYAAFEQLGLEYISSFLKEKGHRTSLVFDPLLFADGYLDIRFLNKAFSFSDYVADRVVSLNPDIVGISSVTDNYLWGCATASRIKKKLDVPIVFGGIHATAVPDRVIKNDFVDFVVVGEGEYPLLDIVSQMESGGELHDIPNVWSKRNGEVVRNEIRELIADLDSLPLPDKDLFYDESPPMADEYRIVTCHGACPNQCTYCCNHILRKLYKGKGKYLRRRSVNNVMSELNLMKEKYNPSIVTFFDEVFFLKKEWLEEFARRYEKEIGIPFKCVTYPLSITEATAGLVKKAGCNVVQIGIQTVNEFTRKNIIRRHETTDEIETAVNILKKVGLDFEIDHIMGFPNEGDKEQIEAIKFYNKIRPPSINFYWLKYFPRTDIIEHGKNYNLLDDEMIDEIEEGLTPSWLKGGNVKNRKLFKKYQSLLILIPILPKGAIDFLLKSGIYRFLRLGTLFLAFSRAVKSLFFYDGRLKMLRKHYTYFMGKKIRLFAGKGRIP